MCLYKTIHHVLPMSHNIIRYYIQYAHILDIITSYIIDRREYLLIHHMLENSSCTDNIGWKKMNKKMNEITPIREIKKKTSRKSGRTTTRTSGKLRKRKNSGSKIPTRSFFEKGLFII